MKKLFLILTLFISVIFSRQTTSAQSLSLDSIIGFPDTVIDNQVVGMQLLVSKTGGIVFTGDITVYMHALGDSTGPDTLFYDSLYTLSGNTFTDTIELTHTFKAADLDGGDNIVVVWPASSMIPQEVSGDSLYFNLFLKNVGIEENEHRQTVHVFPNPSASRVQLLFGFPEKVEQVRVLDVLGKELMRFDEAVESVDVSRLNGGIYFIEVKSRDKAMVVKKFFRD